MATQDPYRYMSRELQLTDNSSTGDQDYPYPNGTPASNYGTNATSSGNWQTLNNQYSRPANPYSQYQNLFDPAQWRDTTQAAQNQQYLDNTLPLAQFQQNQQQYGMDFAEAQRRWNAEMLRQQGNDTYQQTLGNRQMTLAEQQALAAQQQWNQQFGAQQYNDRFSQNLATQQQAQANQQQGWQQQFQTGQQQWNQNIEQQRQDLASRQTDIEAQYRNGLIDVQTAQNEIARINNQNQFLLGQGQNANQLLNYQNQFKLGNRQADIQERLNQGNLGLGQGRLSLDQTLGMGNLDLSRQRLLQDAQLAAEQRATQEKIAAMQATGRSQMPVTRFIANW